MIRIKDKVRTLFCRGPLTTLQPHIKKVTNILWTKLIKTSRAERSQSRKLTLEFLKIPPVVDDESNNTES